MAPAAVDNPSAPVGCKNCSHPLEGRYCTHCGQSVRDYRGSIWQVTAALLEESLGVDGRVWRSLATLVRTPGKLAVEFSAGRRVRYLHPVRFYVFASLLFFFLLAVRSDFDVADALAAAEVDVSEVDVSEIDAGAAEVDRNAQAEIGLVPKPAGDRIDLAVFEPHLAAPDFRRLQRLSREPEEQVVHGVLVGLSAALSDTARQNQPPDRLLLLTLPNVLRLLDDPQWFVTSLVENLPLAMFVLLPFYALLLKLLFAGSGRFYVEHLVFALYLHVLAFLAFSLVILLPERESGWLVILSNVAGPLALGYLGAYTWLAMRNYYYPSSPLLSLSVGWRFLTLGVGYLLLLLPALLVVMAFTVFDL